MRFQVDAEPRDESPGTSDDVPVSRAYRVLRRVAPPEAPFDGRLAHTADGRTVLLVAAAALAGWAGIDAGDDGHVLAPRDLARLPDGIVVEFDWCVERLDGLLSRRERDGAALRAGEAVTLAVSIGRGLAELAVGRPRGADTWPTGEWWLTDAARPVFVHDGRGDPADAAATDVLLGVAALTEDRAVRSAVARLAESGDRDAWTDAEAELFALADAEPVEQAAAPARARSLDAVARLAPGEAVPAEPVRVPGFLERHVDSELPAFASDALHAVVRRLRGFRPRPWQLAAACAAVVLGVGVLWQPGSDGSAAAKDAAAPTSPSASASPDATVARDRSDQPDASASAAAGTPEAITGRLLDARRRCGGDAGCLRGVVEDPERALPHGAIDLEPAARVITMLDEFGGAAVLRVRGTDGASPAQLVVIVESDGEWLLRDVHDVAEETR